MEQREDRVLAIPIEHIDINPAFATRFHWTPEDDAELPGLAESLDGPEGQIAPIIVVTLPEATTFGRRYTLIAGRRRLEAARLRQQRSIAARVLPPVRMDNPVDRLRLFAMAVAENVHRKNLTRDERQEALRRLKLHYDEVYPPSRKRATLSDAAPTYPSFTAWAATQFHISTRAIRQDLRLAQLAHSERMPGAADAPPGHTVTRTVSQAPAGDRSHEAAPPSDPLVMQCQQATAALKTLLALLSDARTTRLPAAEVEDLQRVLEAAITLLVHPGSMAPSVVPCPA